MVVRPKRPVSANEAAKNRRAAQRRLAKEIHSDTYKPSRVGERERLVREINAFKKMVWGDSPKYNSKGANNATRRDVETEKPRSVAELRKMARYAASVLGVTDIDFYEPDEDSPDYETYESLKLYH